MKASTLTRTLAGAALLAPPALLGLGLWIGSEFFVKVAPVRRPYLLRVLEVANGTVTLSRSTLSARMGEFRLEWRGGYGAIGEILELTDKTVKRRFRPFLGTLERGLFVRVRPYAVQDNPLRACGLEYETVRVSSELGELPAWFIPALSPQPSALSKTWAILIHGRSGGPQEFVHAMPTLYKAGLPMLALTYRNHGDAPKSPDGMHHHGHREWKDVEAALEYALEHGAENFVLYGVSMGGNLCLTTLRRSRYAHRIQGLVLDCPALSYTAVLELHADQVGVSRRAARAIARLSEWRSGWLLSEVDYCAEERALGVPTLLLHGDQDTVVPTHSSDLFAAQHQGEVEYLRIHDADHIQSWNVDGAACRAALEHLLARVQAGQSGKPERETVPVG